ncbi:MAG: hypothetical protein DCC49_07480 [Acidobacteria bacterium]|nr:MAG: hypothetical protein DCC49_07480 [Acidobacteriota bacterium]
MLYTALRFLSVCSEAVWQSARFVGVSVWYLMTAPKDAKVRIQALGGRCFTDFFKNLGATFIKIGQILSARPDVLPAWMIEELQTLQDQVPPFGFTAVRTAVESDLGCPLEDVFAEFEQEPIAGASVSQVHKARLADGEVVAVKVRRPGIANTMRRDLSIISGVSRFVDLLPGMSNIGLTRMSKEFAKKIQAQLDFPLEVRNNKRFEENLSDFEFARVPHIHEELCGPNVITMEFIEGKKLSDILDNPPIDPAVMAERMIDIYLSMAFRDFFVHADLHPGNMLIDHEGNYVLLDTGLVHEVPEHYAKKFIRLYMSMMTMNAELIVDTYLDNAEVRPPSIEDAIRDTNALVEKYQDISFSDFEIGKGLVEIMTILRRHRIYLDAELTGFFLSEITFEGVAKMLDGSLDLVNVIPGKIPAIAGGLSFIDADDPVLVALNERVANDEGVRAMLNRRAG